MKKYLNLWLTAFVLMMSQSAFAELPKTLDLQTVVYDQDGNITQEEFVNVTVQIVDENGDVLFEEGQDSIPVVNGAIKLDVGETVGGVSAEALDPSSGRKFINVLVNNENPYALLPLSSVPYAIWADQSLSVADKSILADSIADGAIEARHLSQNLSLELLAGQVKDEQIPDEVARDEEVTNSISSAVNNLQAPAIKLNAGGAFAAQLGETVQVALENIYARLGEEISTRSTSTTNLENTLNTSLAVAQQQSTNAMNTLSQQTTASINNLQQQITTNRNQVNTQITRIDALDSTTQQFLPFAGGKVSEVGVSEHGLNVGASNFMVFLTGRIYYHVSFDQPAPSDNVTVILTPFKNPSEVRDGLNQPQGTPALWNVDRDGFDVWCVANVENPAPGDELSRPCAFSWVAFNF